MQTSKVTQNIPSNTSTAPRAFTRKRNPPHPQGEQQDPGSQQGPNPGASAPGAPAQKARGLRCAVRWGSQCPPPRGGKLGFLTVPEEEAMWGPGSLPEQRSRDAIKSTQEARWKRDSPPGSAAMPPPPRQAPLSPPCAHLARVPRGAATGSARPEGPSLRGTCGGRGVPQRRVPQLFPRSVLRACPQRRV